MRFPVLECIFAVIMPKNSTLGFILPGFPEDLPVDPSEGTRSCPKPKKDFPGSPLGPYGPTARGVCPPLRFAPWTAIPGFWISLFDQRGKGYRIPERRETVTRFASLIPRRVCRLPAPTPQLRRSPSSPVAC